MKYCTHCKLKYEDEAGFCPVDGEQLIDDPATLIGKTFKGHLIEALLGHGGMGVVYLARPQVGNPVAIKILGPKMQGDEQAIRRFQVEAKALRRLSHKNAVAVHDLNWTSDGTIYMVLEFVDGHTFASELLSHGPFTAADAFQILEPVMSALAEAHLHGVIHRDLKLENLMIGKSVAGTERIVKVVDFGVAKVLETVGGVSTGSTLLTREGQIVGTPRYASPEQLGVSQRDGQAGIDSRSDIFSIALAFREMIIGRRMGGANAASQTFAPLHEFVANVPRAFSESIDRALSKDRDDRPKTMHEFAEELRTALGLVEGSRLPSALVNPNGKLSIPLALTETDLPEADQVNDLQPSRAIVSAAAESHDPLKTSDVNSSPNKEMPDSWFRVSKPSKAEGIHVDVWLRDDNEVYPLKFLRESLVGSPSEKLLAPFASLLDPYDCKGTPKWISLRRDEDRVIFESYPYPLRREEAGVIEQPNGIVVVESGGDDQFEYWPDGDANRITFVVELHNSETIKLRLRKVDELQGPILELDITSNERLFGSRNHSKRRSARKRWQDEIETRRLIRRRSGGSSK